MKFHLFIFNFEEIKLINKNYNKFNFLTIKLPICIIVLITLTEILSYSLSNFRAIRHGLDRKVANLESISLQKETDIILFGDSVTKDIADDYNIGSERKILNLTTNKASGLIGVYLLYKRYRLINKPPKQIIISCTPLFLNYFPDKVTKNLYLDTVFNTSVEKKILINYYKNIHLEKEKNNLLNFLKFNLNLTIFNLSNKIIYPLINFLGFIDTKNAIYFGTKKVSSLNDLEILKKSFNTNDKFEYIPDKNYKLKISDQMKILIDDFFKILKNDNVDLFINWAPLREEYHENVLLNGQLKEFENYLLNESFVNKINLLIHDFSAKTTFPNHAFRDNDHLKPGFWKKLYSYLLNKYIYSIS